MPEDQDVTSAAPSAAEGTEVHADSAPVSGEPRPERTIDNVYGEFNRKFGRLQTQLETVLQYIATQNQPRAAEIPPSGQQGQRSMDELYGQAVTGDRAAYEEYHRRLASQQYEQRSQQDRKAQLVTTQLNALVSKYPVLRDAAHPLTQAAHQAYTVLVQNGYPADTSTLVEAAKTAIADRPDLVSEIFSQPAQQREQVRQTATQRAQTGVTGAQHRQVSPTPAATPMKVNPQEADLARRMGIKDPGKSKERFLKRQEMGQSSLGSVAAFVNDQEF